MTIVQNRHARKRPVNLTLSEDLLAQAKGLTNNLSAIVEDLLADYVAQRQEERNARKRQAEAAALAWNAFNERAGSFADEHSTL